MLPVYNNTVLLGESTFLVHDMLDFFAELSASVGYHGLVYNGQYLSDYDLHRLLGSVRMIFDFPLTNFSEKLSRIISVW